MDHFKGLNEQERYQNDLLNEMRKQTELLEQIAQLLQNEKEKPIKKGRVQSGGNDSNRGRKTS